MRLCGHVTREHRRAAVHCRCHARTAAGCRTRPPLLVALSVPTAIMRNSLLVAGTTSVRIRGPRFLAAAAAAASAATARGRGVGTVCDAVRARARC